MNGQYLANLLSETYTNKYIWGGARWDSLTIDRLGNPAALENYGYKVYSQNDEDGIIEEIFNRIGTKNKRFIEFGVQDGLESNTHYLLFKDWSGLWIECDSEAFEKINRKFVNVIREGNLKVLCEFITKDNINELFKKAGFTGEIDLLSIDIDGNDYYVFENISVVNPRVIIAEYNGKFPPNYEWKQPYFDKHLWDGTDKHGASLAALNHLANEKGYKLVCTNLNGCNAFFVRNDLITDAFIGPMTPEYMYNPMRVNLKHISGHPSGNCLYKMRDGIQGVMDFADESGIIFVYGFSDIEENKGEKFRFISAIESEIFYKAHNGQDRICINYLNPFVGVDALNLSVCQNGELVKSFFVESYEGMIEIPLSELVGANGCYILELKMNKLIVPAEVTDSTDHRKLGIGLYL
ncbi:MAG: hypothetical protein K6C99_02630 [Lachnospiraceae bacterium]|nr:hypothetical protein [Lachnospiraceae bacterium]